MDKSADTHVRAKPYFEFMERVAAEYRDSGARVQIEVDLAGENVDVLVRHELPSGELVRVAVECKHHARNIGIRSVERFASVVKTLRLAGKIETGTMVSLKGYGDRANALAIEHGIHLITFNDLRYRLNKLRSLVEARVESESAVAHVGGREFIPMRGTLLNGVDVTDVSDYLLEWLTSSASQLLLLGEGGAGKTTISRNLALRVGQLYLRGDTDRIPLLVDLKGAEVSGLITEILCRELDRAGVALPTARLVELVKSGRLLVILDGFDELEMGKMQRGVMRNFLDFDQLASPRSKILITCRRGFFRSTGQILDYELGSERCPLVPGRREDLVVTIDDLSADIVRKHLADHATIASVYGGGIPEWLIHLCNRPLHLKMIMRVADPSTSAEELNRITTRHALYDRYVSKSISWDAERPGAVPHDPRERRVMCEALAAQMLNEGATIIDDELVARAIGRARLEFGRDTDLVSRDLLRSTLLQTSGQGTMWGHKSYGEFLGASHVLGLLRGGRTDFEFIWFTRDERAFIAEMLEPEDIESLKRWLRGQDYVPLQFGAFIAGGTEAKEVVGPLWEAVEANDDLLTRINCLNSLGFLGDTAAAPGIVGVVGGFLTFRGIQYELPGGGHVDQIAVSECEALRTRLGLPVLLLHIRESVDALSRVVGPEYIGFLRCALMDEDPQFVSEVREAIRRLGTDGAERQRSRSDLAK